MTLPHIVLSASTIALLGKGAISLIRHAPAPGESSVFYRWIFDTAQDLAGNNDRIGQVRSISIPN
jgi:hypothetical protein